MNTVERFTYAVGRAIGSGAREFLNTMWPPSDPQVAAAEAMTPDAPKRDWLTTYGGVGAGRPVFVGGARQWVEPQSVDDALAGVDDETDWFTWAPPQIADTLANIDAAVWVPAEWITVVANIVSERLAADPAKAIAALWNYQLRRQETT